MKNKIIGLMLNLYRRPIYRVFMFLLGLPTWIVGGIFYFKYKAKDGENNKRLKESHLAEMEICGEICRIKDETRTHLQNRNNYFKKQIDEGRFESEWNSLVEKEIAVELEARMVNVKGERIENKSLGQITTELLENNAIFALSVITSFPLYLLLLLCYNSFMRYTVERILMMFFVIFGVVFVVFTILHASPMDPAINVLGEMATPQQIQDFNRVYGLDQPYITQLFSQFKKLVTFDLGKSFSGNENVLESILRKFPVTLAISWRALLLSVVIAIPIGIISAIKPYTAYDYVFMFIALVGISLPSFWFGMIMILTFSINLGLLPASFVVENSLSYIMPSIVLGVGLAASLTRMTRSSLLEVVKQDYIVTARAKGLSEFTVIMKHALGNALIPIITTVGLSFGAMLGGAAVVEKVFSIKGIGSYIIEKQFLPDIPIILAGVVYVAVIISLVNLAVDLIYAAVDPRIRSKIRKQ